MASKSKSNFLLLLSAITLIVILGGLFFSKYISGSKSPVIVSDSTVNWKIYENSKFGFSFKYPPELVFSDATDEGGDIANVPLKIYLTGSRYTIMGAVEKRLCNDPNGKQKITIDNKSGIRFVEEDQMNGILFSYDIIEVVLENKLCLGFRKYVENKNPPTEPEEISSTLKAMTNQNKDTFDQILSTFQFIN